MKERRRPLDHIDKLVKDPEIRKVVLRKGLRSYEELLKNSNVDKEDVRKSIQILASRVEAPELSQRNARHLLGFFESVGQPKKIS